MKDFKLIAIRPLKDCDIKFSKILKRGDFYVLHNAYNFSTYEDFVNEEIKYIKDYDIDLYSTNDTKINITAVAGKNGSGKSSIAELLYSLIFCLSQHKSLGFLEDVKIKEDHEFTDEESIQFDKDVKDLEKLKLEIFYILNGELFRIRKDKSIEIHIFNNEGITFRIGPRKNLSKAFIKNNFFYSIAVNYSLYGLNTNETGLWLKPLFHKNDAYQTPLVLDPMRTEGIIDINKVTYLSKARLLSNILRPIATDVDISETLRCLVNNKIADKIILDIDYRKFDLFKRGVNKGKPRLEYFRKYRISLLYRILNTYKNFDDEELSKEEVNKKFRSPKEIEKITIEYILKKLEKIAKTYSIKGKIYGDKFSLSDQIVVFDLLDELETDYSHITFKLRQAINFLRYDFSTVDKNLINYELSVAELSNDIGARINDFKFKDENQEKEKVERRKKANKPSGFLPEGSFFYLPNSRFELVNFLPPSFFNIDIRFKHKGSYNSLSSGEKQKVFSINSIIYHLVNLKSVDGETKVRYDYVNLIFDEVELYFHPEFQRTFITDLLGYISRTNISFNGINIMFITHSPFILSDLPKSNILFLEVKSDSKFALQVNTVGQTFASNIHELLARGFFMNFTKGEFALNKITEIIEFYEKVRLGRTEDWNDLRIEFQSKRLDFKDVIRIIGEDYIREILENNLNYIEYKLEIFFEDSITTKINSLQSEIQKLERMKSNTKSND
ncbi:hypothetical protein [Flavobacterium sp.]|uniref:AAA family ATPase n=1 Tax=Flavobacterium sp. TaxID=239 RepID=UPI002616B30A|nr:hypothetical protein [Flavobacterium sp.]